MTLEKRIIATGNAVLENKGTNVPSWFGDEANKSKWFSSSNTHVDWFYSVNDDTAYLQYGQNVSLWAGCRHLIYSAKVLSETINSDNSITAQVALNVVKYTKHNTDFAAGGVRVIETIDLGGKSIFVRDGNTTDEFSQSNFNNNPQTVTVTIQPEGTNNFSALVVHNDYPNGEFVNNDVTVGFQLYNPLPKQYVPGGVKNQSSWLSNNRNGKRNYKKNDGSWTVIAKENIDDSGKVDTGHERVKKDGSWRQAQNEDANLN